VCGGRGPVLYAAPPALTPTQLDEIRARADAHEAHGIRTTAFALAGDVRPLLRLIDDLQADTALAAIRALHTPGEETVITFDCLEGDCGHPDTADGCPTVNVKTCQHCTNLSYARDSEILPGEAMWPCATIKALEEAGA
jgi:hypothetical protein